MGTKRALWEDYRVTWDAYSQSFEHLEACVASGDRPSVEAALLTLENARAAHNAARDRLTEELAALPHAAASRKLRNEEEEIRERAHMVWELLGRPQNSAEADWLMAERVVRSAAAA